MTLVFATLSWLFLAKIVYEKQRKVSDNITANFLAVFAPLTVIIYAIRAVFFEDWI